MSAGGVEAARSAIQRAGGGAIPTPALHSLRVVPIPIKVAKEVIVRNHYLRSLPGGTQLAFGVFLNGRLMGAVTLGVGPFNSHRLVEGAPAKACLTLSRFWLAHELPKNSASKVIGTVLRFLKKHTNLKADHYTSLLANPVIQAPEKKLRRRDSAEQVSIGDEKIYFIETSEESFDADDIRNFRREWRSRLINKKSD